MGQTDYDIDTVGIADNVLGGFYDFQVNNTFYLLAPTYYYPLYSIYFRKSLCAYDGWISAWHNVRSGLVPQRALQSIAQGLNNMLFAYGIDFAGDIRSYQFAKTWAKKEKFYKSLKKAHLLAIAGGTSLLKINRRGDQLYTTAHRIDTFFVDVADDGTVERARIYFDVLTNTTPDSKKHYGVCEERYFENGRPMVEIRVYLVPEGMINSVSARPKNDFPPVPWDSLPRSIKQQIAKKYPSALIGEPQYLPFYNSLGCHLIRFTDEIPQYPDLPFGRPIGDILFTENLQYDQMKYFERNEVDLARARALIPDQMWNRDDPLYNEHALSERFFQKVTGLDNDSDKVTPIQFNLRGSDIKTEKENILKDIAFKLNVSASSVASFLSDGAGAMTATQIVSERTKSDTWINSQINLNQAEIDATLAEIMRYYNMEPVEVLLKSENQSPFLDTIKTLGDQLSAGNITPRLFVKMVYKNLSVAEQEKEIAALEEQKMLKDEQKKTMLAAYTQAQGVT